MNIINHVRSSISGPLSQAEFQQAIKKSDQTPLEILVIRRAIGIKNELEFLGSKELNFILETVSTKTTEVSSAIIAHAPLQAVLNTQSSINPLLCSRITDSAQREAAQKKSLTDSLIAKIFHSYIQPYLENLSTQTVLIKCQEFEKTIPAYFQNGLSRGNDALAALKTLENEFNKFPLSIEAGTNLNEQCSRLKEKIVNYQIQHIKTIFRELNEKNSELTKISRDLGSIKGLIVNNRTSSLSQNTFSPARYFINALENNQEILDLNNTTKDLLVSQATVWQKLEKAHKDLYKMLALPYKPWSFNGSVDIDSNILKKRANYIELLERSESVDNIINSSNNFTNKAKEIEVCLNSLHTKTNLLITNLGTVDLSELEESIQANETQKSIVEALFKECKEALIPLQTFENIFPENPGRKIDYDIFLTEFTNKITEAETKIYNLKINASLIKKFSKGDFTDLTISDFMMRGSFVYSINIPIDVYDRLKDIITTKLSQKTPKEERILYKKNLKTWLNSQAKDLQAKFNGMRELKWTFAESFFRFLSWIADLFKKEQGPKEAGPTALNSPPQVQEQAAAADSTSLNDSSLDELILNDSDFEPEEQASDSSLAQLYLDAEWERNENNKQPDDQLNPFLEDIGRSDS